MRNKLLMLFVLLTMANTSYAHDLEPLHVDGRYLKNPEGNIVTLHGLQQCVHPFIDRMGAIWGGDDYEKAVKYNKEWIDSLLMVDWKIDYMRLQIGAGWIVNRATNNYDLDYFKQKGFFDKVYVPIIDYMNSKGIYAVLYYDGIRPAEEEKYQIGDLTQRYALEFWDYVSSHPKIKDNPGVMMELYNEPTGFIGSDSHSDDFRDVKNYFQPMVDVIRQNGCNSVIWIPGIGYQVWYSGYSTHPIKGENIGYAFHAYPWWGISYEENNAPWWKSDIQPVGNMAPLMITETYWWNSDPDVNETSEFGIGLKNDIDRMGNVSWNLLTDHSWDVVRVNEPSPDGSITENNDDEFALVPTWNWFKEYADSKILPVSHLKAVSVEMEDAPTSLYPGESRALKLMAKFDNGNTWNVAGDAVWSSSDETVLSIDRGNIFVKKEGQATVCGTYTDGTGKIFETQFEVNCHLFQLTSSGVNYNDFNFPIQYDEASQSFSGEGMRGWSSAKGFDFSAYHYLVVRLYKEPDFGAEIWLEDGSGEQSRTTLSWKTEVVIDLQALTGIDMTHIEKVLFWVWGGPLSVKEIFLSNDGVNPVTEPFAIRTLANTDDKVMHYGDEVPELTYSVVGPDLSQVPALSTNVTKGSAVGAYDISIAGNEDGVDYYPGKLHVIPAPLTASTGNLSLKEGEEIPVITPKYDGFKNGDTEATAFTTKPTASATIVGWAVAGSYPIRVNGDGKVSNYSIDYDQTGVLTVKEANCMDYTALVGTSQESWKGAWNPCENVPAITTSDGRQAQLVEHWKDISETGELMSQTITGLPNGDYVVGVYVNAREDADQNRFIASDIAYVSANDVRVYVPAYVGHQVFENGECGIRTTVTDGTLRIAMVAEKPGTNWHTIQIKRLVRIGEDNVPIAGPQQYAAAQAAIEYEKPYCIYTTFNGTEEGTQRYYLTTDGYLTSRPELAGIFTFYKTEGDDLFHSPGWKLDACFSNPKLSGNGGESGDLNPQGHILVDMAGRDDWEGQVWYLDENGRFAVRATNAVYDGWGSSTFWTVLDTDGDGKPEADYSWTQAFVWQLESDVTVVEVTPEDGDLTARVATSPSAWNAMGVCATQFAPAVTTSDGRSAQMVETYETTVATTGEMMYQTVSGLEEGYYAVELYANAQYTDGRGFGSDLKDGATDVVYVSANDRRSYVTAHVGTTVAENGVYTVCTPVSDGTLRISLVAEKPGTNWHTIQIKSLRKVDGIITANDLTMTYGDEVPRLTYFTEGAEVEGQPVLSCAATKASPAGTYPITISQGTVTNGNMGYAAGILTITKAPLKISAGTYTKKQGEENPEFTLAYEGFVNGETEAVLTKQPTVTCEATKESTPGEYAVNVAGAEAENYEISYVPGTLTVTGADDGIIAGDINGNDEVDDEDVDAFIELYLDDEIPEPGDADFSRFDANGDGIISLADAVAIFYLSNGLNFDGTDPNAARMATPMDNGEFLLWQASPRAERIMDNYCNLTVEATDLGNGIVRYTLTSDFEYAGFAVDVKGAQVVSESAEGMTLRSAETKGKHRIVAYNFGQAADAGTVLTLDVLGEAQFSNINFSDANARNIRFRLGEATGISDVGSQMSDVRGEVYDLQGRESERMKKGVNILRTVNGKAKKMSVK